MLLDSENISIVKLIKNSLLAFLLFLIIHIVFVYDLHGQGHTVIAGVFLGIAFDLKILSMAFLPAAALSFFLKGSWNKLIVALHLTVLLAYVIVEAAMSFFTIKSGFLISREIFIRPIPEMWTTIKNSAHTSAGILSLLILALIGFLLKRVVDKYLRITIRKSKRNRLITLAIPAFVGIVIKAPEPYQLTHNVYYNMAVNKLAYLVTDVWEYKFSEEAINPIISKRELLDYRIDRVWYFENLSYPIMRPSNDLSTLYPFFNKANSSPNIVFILVESLGSQICGPDARWGSFTPFLDSLARHSLYWTNCLASTERTFGVLPSTLGSLPMGYNGFQFGVIPYHTSLLKILNNNNYYSTFHYAGYPEFDNMKAFMIQEHIDTIPLHLKDFEEKKYGEQSTDWGIDDKILFRKILEEDVITKNKKTIDVVLTITTHEILRNKETEYYTRKFQQIIAGQKDENKKKKAIDATGYLTSYLYTDDAIKEYFKNKQKEENFNNTIFVITGDHSNGLFSINQLDKYRVPLIIYSPLLKKGKKMNAVVSHLDITPSLIRLLEKQDFIKQQKYQAWVGDQIDTTAYFRNATKRIFMRSSRKKIDFYDDDFFLSENILYKVDSNLNIHTDTSKLIKEQVQASFNLYNKIDNYIKDANHIIDPHQFGIPSYRTISHNKINTTISVLSPKYVKDLFSEKLPTNNYGHIRLLIKGEVFLDTIYPDASSMSLVIRCRADKDNTDRGAEMLKLVESEKEPRTWMKFSLSGEFTISDATKRDLDVYIWNGPDKPGDRLKFRNLEYIMEGY